MRLQLSVIILNYNVCHYLELCISSVKRAILDMEAEIIVIDNASTDDSLAMLSRKHPNIKVIANTQNVGFAKANNQGAAQAKGRYLCILNPDTVVPEDCFQVLLAFAERQQKVGAIGAYLMDGGGRFLPESKRNLPTPAVAFSKMLGGDRFYYNQKLEPREIGETPVLVGAFMFLKKAAYQALGGFDEDYFMYGEDIDLSYRLQQAGFRNYYHGSLSIIHFKGESTLKNKTYARHFYGAMAIFYKKHFDKNFGEKILVNSLLTMAKTFKLMVSAKSEKHAGFLPWILFGDDPEFVKLARAHFGEDLLVCSKRALDRPDVEKSRIVFDANTHSYDTIIKTMAALKNRQNKFYIRPPGCNFILGSAYRAGQGRVINLDGLKN